LFTTPEHDHYFDLVSGSEEPLDMALLGLIVVRVDLQPEPNLLERGIRLVPTGFPSLHIRLVLVLAVVHEFRDGWLSIGGDFNQVEIRLSGKAKRVLYSNNSDLFTTRSN